MVSSLTQRKFRKPYYSGTPKLNMAERQSMLLLKTGQKEGVPLHCHLGMSTGMLKCCRKANGIQGNMRVSELYICS